MSFVAETNVLTLLACAGAGLPVLVSERSDPRRYRIGAVWAWLRRRLYPRARAVVVQTEQVRHLMAEEIPGARVEVIPNPALLPEGIPVAKGLPEGGWPESAVGMLRNMQRGRRPDPRAEGGRVAPGVLAGRGGGPPPTRA